jgi:cAMP-binding proteins - catabolite gene activator and regulatory subunit of cAMP-dependent protein kinases
MSDLLISNLSKHVPLTEEEKEIILSLFQPKQFRRRQYMLQEGEVSRFENFMLSGLTRTYEVDDKGQEHVVSFGMADWWVGDMYSFLTNTPSRYNIDCLEDTEVLQITRENQELLFQKVPKMERHFRILVQNAYIASINRISASLMQSAADRYRDFLERYPKIGERVPNHQIASYLGITPQSLSRIRNQRAGINKG